MRTQTVSCPAAPRARTSPGAGTMAAVGLMAGGLAFFSAPRVQAAAHGAAAHGAANEATTIETSAEQTMTTQKTEPATTRASGTFNVVITPLPLDEKAEDGVSAHMSLAKQFHGDIDGTGKGQMLAAGTAVEGSGSYVALERVSGTLKGRRGTFMLQHSGRMSKAGGMHLNITVVPDSGTADLTGLTGTFTIKIEGSKHFYDFDYALPAAP